MSNSFQNVEGLSALQSSIRFIPHPIVGTITNILTAYLVSLIRVQYLAVVSALVTVSAPVLMAIVRVGENYWFAPFWALILSPINADGESLAQIVAMLAWQLTNVLNYYENNSPIHRFQYRYIRSFPRRRPVPGRRCLQRGLSVRELGRSCHNGSCCSVRHLEDTVNRRSSRCVDGGYRAALWTVFAATAVVLLVTSVGLRKAGTIGRKED